MSIEALLIWFEFAVCALLIGIAGATLSRYADIISDKTGFSRGWIGLILLATVTSLPELITGISSVTLADVPNIAVGDVFGSCVFNLVILVILDFMLREESVYRRASQGHILSAGFGVVLIGFAGLNVLLADRTAAFDIGHIGPYTPVIVLLYLIAMRAIFVYERTQLKEFAEQMADRHPEITLRTAITRYVFAACMVVAAGAFLPFIAAHLAQVMGWQNTFVGTLLVAGVTSLPELVVTIAALRIGALDMAIANLLGSNLFNIAILAIDDLLFFKGPLLSHVSLTHAMSAMSAVVMTGVIVIGLVYRPNTRLFVGVGWISLGLFTFYLLNSYVIYLHGE
ncbi:MAG: sodium:calcium antiporter [Sideroxydans sp.]|nr:sodium:calcium antiporter [Sideroxydans sp.]